MFINDILQPTHLLFILVVALLVLGPKRLPEAGRALGNGIRSFRSAIGGEEDRSGAIPTEAAPSPPPEAMAPPAVSTTVEPTPVTPVTPVTPEPKASPAEPPTEVMGESATEVTAPTDPTASTAETAEQHAEPVHPVG